MPIKPAGLGEQQTSVLLSTLQRSLSLPNKAGIGSMGSMPGMPYSLPFPTLPMAGANLPLAAPTIPIPALKPTVFSAATAGAAVAGPKDNRGLAADKAAGGASALNPTSKKRSAALAATEQIAKAAAFQPMLPAVHESDDFDVYDMEGDEGEECDNDTDATVEISSRGGGKGGASGKRGGAAGGNGAKRKYTKRRGGYNGRSENELMLLDPKRVKRILANREVRLGGKTWPANVPTLNPLNAGILVLRSHLAM